METLAIKGFGKAVDGHLRSWNPVNKNTFCLNFLVKPVLMNINIPKPSTNYRVILAKDSDDLHIIAANREVMAGVEINHSE